MILNPSRNHTFMTFHCIHFRVLLAGGIGSLLLESFNWRSVFYIMGMSLISWFLLKVHDVHFFITGLLSFIWLSVMITMVLPLEKQKTQQSLTSGENSSQKASHEVHSTHVPWRLILTKVSFWLVFIPGKKCTWVSEGHLLLLVPSYRLSKNEKAIILRISSLTSVSPLWLNQVDYDSFRAIIVCHVCSTNAYFIVVSWLPTYFHETFPSEKASPLGVISPIPSMLSNQRLNISIVDHFHFQGWVFNVVPWLVAVPSRWFGGYLADKLISKGQPYHSVLQCHISLLCLVPQNNYPHWQVMAPHWWGNLWRSVFSTCLVDLCYLSSASCPLSLSAWGCWVLPSACCSSRTLKTTPWRCSLWLPPSEWARSTPVASWSTLRTLLRLTLDQYSVSASWDRCFATCARMATASCTKRPLWWHGSINFGWIWQKKSVSR